MYKPVNLLLGQYATPYRYYINGFDATWYIMNNIPVPFRWEGFFEVVVR